MYVVYKFRLYPTIEQTKTLIDWQNQLRFIWNYFLEQNNNQYKIDKTFIWKYAMQKQLPQLKKIHNWLTAPSQALQHITFDLDDAISRCVKKKISQFPKFKRKGIDYPSIQIPQIIQTNYHQIKWTNNKIQIPKLGYVKFKYSRKIQGKLKSISIKQDVRHWYVMMLVKQEDVPQLTNIKQENIVGLDLGIKNFGVTSDGEVIDGCNLYRKNQKKLKRLQRTHNKAQKGSNNRNKKQMKVAKLHQKIRFQRNDFHHKLSNSIAKNYDLVIIEDLNIKGMIKNHKLAKAISDQGWTQFTNQLDYKLRNKGNMLYKINRWAASTKTCSCCGNKKHITLDERTYICSSCELVMDRDLNAAINIKNFGIKEINTAEPAGIYACGDTSNGDSLLSSYVSLKQEPIS